MPFARLPFAAVGSAAAAAAIMMMPSPCAMTRVFGLLQFLNYGVRGHVGSDRRQQGRHLRDCGGTSSARRRTPFSIPGSGGFYYSYTSTHPMGKLDGEKKFGCAKAWAQGKLREGPPCERRREPRWISSGARAAGSAESAVFYCPAGDPASPSCASIGYRPGLACHKGGLAVPRPNAPGEAHVHVGSIA